MVAARVTPPPVADTAARAHAERPRLELILAALRAEGARWGADLGPLSAETLQFEIQRDPSSGEEALTARWERDGRRGQLTLRADGHAWAEHDLLIDHPRRPAFWIEAVTAWGCLPELRTEPRLLVKLD